MLYVNKRSQQGVITNRKTHFETISWKCKNNRVKGVAEGELRVKKLKSLAPHANLSAGVLWLY